jgi:hypothetical protein
MTYQLAFSKEFQGLPIAFRDLTFTPPVRSSGTPERPCTCDPYNPLGNGYEVTPQPNMCVDAVLGWLFVEPWNDRRYPLVFSLHG